MIKKMLGVFASMVTALAVVGVAWAGTDDPSTSLTTAGEASTDVSIDGSSPSTDATTASSTGAKVASSTDAKVASSTGAKVVTAQSSTGATAQSSTSAKVDSSTSTSLAPTTSTSVDSGAATSTTVGSTTSTSTGADARDEVPDGITVHTIPGVGTVTIEAALGQLILVDVSTGWSVEFDKVESDRIKLEFTSEAEAEAEFEARIDDGRVEVRIEAD